MFSVAFHDLQQILATCMILRSYYFLVSHHLPYSGQSTIARSLRIVELENLLGDCKRNYFSNLVHFVDEPAL